MRKRKLLKLFLLLVLFYFGLQCIVGLALWSPLHQLIRDVAGSKAGYTLARVDLLSGRVVLHGVRADGWLLTEKMRAGTVAISLRYSDLKQGRRQIKKVKVKRPLLVYDTRSKHPPVEEADPNSLPQPYLVEEIAVRSGKLIFLDPKADNFEIRVVGIKGRIKDLTNNVSLIEERSKIELGGKIAGERKASCRLWGSFNPRFPRAYFHLNLDLVAFPLPAFSPYGDEAYFERGWIDYELRAISDNYNLRVMNKALLRDIQIKERKFSLRKLIGLSADRISEHINRRQGGFQVQFTTSDSMHRDMTDIFIDMVLVMAGECQKALKAEAGATMKSNLKGILF